ADPTRGPCRAAINAFGFGGINAHAVLEEYGGPDDRRHRPTRRGWPTELVMFSAGDRRSLIAQLRLVTDIIAANPAIPLAIVSRWLSTLPPAPCRLAMICRDVSQLGTMLSTAIDDLQSERPSRRRDTYSSDRAVGGEVGFLFPGEGSQHQNML